MPHPPPDAPSRAPANAPSTDPSSTAPGVTGHRDPAGEAPWAMQLVAHVPTGHTLTHEAVCAAAATAVVQLLAHPNAEPDGAWNPAITRWLDGRIRKLVRRAKATRWEAAQTVPGVTVEVAGAQVRALVPGPTDHVPATISRLQVSGFDLTSTEPTEPTGPARTRHPALSSLVHVHLNPHLPLSTGKAAAQAAHAAQLAMLHMEPDQRRAWAAVDHLVAVDVCDPDQWTRLAVSSAGRPARSKAVAVHDAGFTEIPAGSLTAIATW